VRLAKVPVNPAVLAWARTERALTEKAAAEKIGFGLDKLLALEAGLEQPTIGELRDMAAAYQIGFSALLMPEPLPPQSKPRINDFRTLRSDGSAISHELAVVLEDTNVLIDGLAELRGDASHLFPPLALPAVKLTDDPRRVAEAERRRLGVSVLEQLGWERDTTAFRWWRAVVEGQGIFVYLRKAATPAEWRGFSVLDERGIPCVVINSEEAEYTARIFTLMHEYGHILLRTTGISDEEGSHQVEVFCNTFAAYFLMPPNEFSIIAKQEAEGLLELDSDSVIRRVAQKFKTSMSAVALHLEQVGLTGEGTYKRKIDEWKSRMLRRGGGGVVTYAERNVNQLGTRHVKTVFDALDAGYINHLDAHELLRVSPKHFGHLRDEVAERQAVYGLRRQ
jgi:Zn-dependent peptidase ImmA (M78 family)